MSAWTGSDPLTALPPIGFPLRSMVIADACPPAIQMTTSSLAQTGRVPGVSVPGLSAVSTWTGAQKPPAHVESQTRPHSPQLLGSFVRLMSHAPFTVQRASPPSHAANGLAGHAGGTASAAASGPPTSAGRESNDPSSVDAASGDAASAPW